MSDEITIVVRAEDAFSSVLGNFGNIMTGIKSTIDLVSGAIQTFTGFAMEGLNSIAFYERLETSLTSLNAAQMVQNGMAENVSAAWDVASLKAQDLLGWMQELAIHSPFTLDGVATAFRMAEAYGFNAEQAKQLTQDLIDFAAATGAPESAMQRIALALGQISAAGHLTGQDMNQLVQAGLPVLQILADYFGITTAKVIELRTAGLLPAQDVIKAITEYIETNFAGAAEKQATSWAGLLGTFQDIQQMGLREFFGGLFDALQPVAIALSNWLQGPGMQMIGTLGDMLGNLTNNILDKFKDYAPVFNTLNQAMMEFVNLINNDWTPLQALEKILSELSIIWQGSPLEGVVTFIQDIIKGFETGNWDTVWDKIKTAFATGWSIVAPIISEFITGILNNMENGVNNWIAGGGADRVSNSLIDAMTVTVNSPTFTSNMAIAGTALARALGKAFELMWKDPELAAAFWGGSDAFMTTQLSKLGTAIGDLFTSAFVGLVNVVGDILITLLFPPSLYFRLKGKFDEIGRSAIEGIQSGLSSILPGWWVTWWTEHIIDPVKKLLGIASPSTIFLQIGKDIIQGLINGISSMIDSVTTIIKRILSAMLDPLKPILDFLGIDFSSILGTSSTGSVGGGTPTGHTTTNGTGTTGGGASSVEFKFYGPVYMNGAPLDGNYDCPPNIIIQAGANQIVTSGY